MTQTDLNVLRNKINQLDEDLVRLLNARASLAIEVGKIKSQISKQVYDPVREKQVLQTLTKLNQGPLPKGALKDIYAAIITACRELQIEQA